MKMNLFEKISSDEWINFANAYAAIMEKLTPLQQKAFIQAIGDFHEHPTYGEDIGEVNCSFNPEMNSFICKEK